MSDKPLPKKCEDEESAFEMIELAIDEVALLTRAFDMVKRVCENAEDGEEESSAGIPERLLH